MNCSIIKNENDQLKSELQSKNNSATTETDNTEINKDKFFDEELTLLQSENEQLRGQLSILRKQLSTQSINAIGDDPSMLEKAMDLEMKLEIALARIEQMEGQQKIPDDLNVAVVEELAKANQTIDQLNDQIESMIARQAEAELELAMLENTSMEIPTIIYLLTNKQIF